MKRLASLIVLAVVATLTLGSGASASTSFYYAGKTSQKFDLLFQDVRVSGSEFVVPFSFDANITCPAGLGNGEAEFDFSGFEVPVVNGRFSLVENDPSARFHWDGKINNKSAAGTLGIAFPAFTDSGRAVACTSGDVTWKASKLVPASRRSQTAATAKYRIDVSRNASGAISVTVTTG